MAEEQEKDIPDKGWDAENDVLPEGIVHLLTRNQAGLDEIKDRSRRRETALNMIDYMRDYRNQRGEPDLQAGETEFGPEVYKKLVTIIDSAVAKEKEETAQNAWARFQERQKGEDHDKERER